jgi:methyl-accepting chemotaxis protein
MNFVKNLKIGTRLGLAFASVLVLTLIVGIGAIFQLARIQDNVKDLATNWLPAARALGDFSYELAGVQRGTSRHLLATAPAQLAGFEKEIEDRKAAAEAALKRYEATVESPEETRLLEAVKTSLAAYYATLPKLLALSRDESKNAEAQAMFNTESRATFNAVLAANGEALKFQDAGGAKANADAQAMYERTRLGISVLLLVVLLIGAAQAYLATRSITVPVGQAVHAARRVSEGDLTTVIEAHSKDEIGQLLLALRHMNDSLVNIVSQVRASSDSIATGSAQIATGNADLSQRTEEQASNLEETAASMEQLTATVKQNADTSRQATQLASSASKVAVEGGEAVGQVVGTMDKISASSKKIADIIGVIDGIAFQTNILALNAAVEAARAGEQGRGFAVVAGEVRSLASRSAAAAKEIKQLIGESVETVEAGSTLVNGAGKTMQEIVTQVRRVSDLIGEISAASAEQSQGISQVGEAVTQLDQVTQQNAALVEESAAAADSLKHQAARLAEVVSVFKLDAHAVVRPVAAPVTAQRPATPAAPRPPASVKSAKPAAAPRIAAKETSDEGWSSF